MTREGATALARERHEALALGRSLERDEWAQPSACPGWSVQDVYAHLSASFHPTLSTIRAFIGPEIEAGNDVLVDQRRSRDASEQLAEYEAWSGRAVRLLFALQRRPLSAVPVPLADLGRHPAHLLADAAAFDHYVHLRLDLLAPRGPLRRDPPASDPLRLRPVVRWMLRLLPRLGADALAGLPGPVALSLAGPGGGDWTLGPGEGVRSGSPVAPVAGIVSSTEAFPAWATKRADWRECGVDVEGDEQVAEALLDAIHII